MTQDTSTNNEILVVSYLISEYYAEQCAVSIVSLFENNKGFGQIQVFIIEDGLKEKTKCRFFDMAKHYNRNIDFIAMPSPQAFWNDPRFTFNSVGRTFCRMILGQLLPATIDKVLCFDSDLLIVDSLDDLWNTQMDDTYLAGVINGVGDKVLTKMLHVSDDIRYFNGGVYLINLKLIRKDGIEQQYFRYMKSVFDSGKMLDAYEEGVMNIVCYPKTKVLHPRYNLMTINLVMSYSEFIKFRGTSYYYSEELLDQAKQNPAIIHMANLFYLPLRPWEKNSAAPYSVEYWNYRMLTPWKEDSPIQIKRSAKQKVLKIIWHIMPRKLAFGIASFIRNDIRPYLKNKRDDI